jgi:phosphoserine aminotransferase
MRPRGYNFGAGPGCMPEEVLSQAQTALWNWEGKGMSILELGFRTPEFVSLLEETQALFRQVLSIPDDFEVLFFGGPARAHFAYVPLNLLKPEDKAAYIVSGIWSDLSYKEASRLLPKQVYLQSSSEATQFLDSPKKASEILDRTKYLYYCPNETIAGFEYHPPASLKGVPWVADMTSSILSESIDFSQYGLIFAGAQKNVSNAGLSLVMVRKEWIKEDVYPSIPLMDDYRLYAKEQSLYATPPVFNIYLMNLMMKWVIDKGGVSYFSDLSLKKSKLMYEFLDQSPMYRTFVNGPYRSRINVAFTTGDEHRDLALIHQAEQSGLYCLKGHRSLGGIRASLYNAMPLEGVKKLLDFLKDFRH